MQFGICNLNLGVFSEESLHYTNWTYVPPRADKIGRVNSAKVVEDQHFSFESCLPEAGNVQAAMNIDTIMRESQPDLSIYGNYSNKKKTDVASKAGHFVQTNGFERLGVSQSRMYGKAAQDALAGITRQQQLLINGTPQPLKTMATSISNISANPSNNITKPELNSRMQLSLLKQLHVLLKEAANYHPLTQSFLLWKRPNYCSEIVGSGVMPYLVPFATTYVS